MKNYHYTIGVSRKFWFGYKIYKKVTKHFYENVVNNAAFPLRLVLVFSDGSELSIGGVEDKSIKVFDDYKSAHDKALNDNMELEAKAEELVKHREEQRKSKAGYQQNQNNQGGASPADLQALARQRGLAV